jgi:hypothetical protein
MQKKPFKHYDPRRGKETLAVPRWESLATGPRPSRFLRLRLSKRYPIRNTRTFSATLPPDMLKRAQSIAKKESCTLLL